MIIVSATWIARLRWTVVLAGACLCAACGPGEETVAPPRSATAAAPAEQFAAGEKVYEMHCAQCHYAGEGGANAPPLTNSPVVLAAPAATYRVILQGQRNRSIVDGRKLNGIMPAMDYLSDEEIASVTAYLRQRFAGKSETLDPAEVRSFRKN
ncbi:MAG: cytochrome c [Chthoniobacterales bacterium]|nr:cytochrome c [Chthoniobacterales bacterium]